MTADGAGPTLIYCPQCGQAMLVAAGHMNMTVACPSCRSALEAWRFAPTVPSGGFPRVGGAPPSAGTLQVPGAGAYSWRNRWVAGVLGVLLGAFGVHRFYLGFTGIGLLQALLSVGTCFVLSPTVAVWGFVEGILCFCGAMRDADGLPLRE